MDYIYEAKEFLKNYRSYKRADKNLKDKLVDLETALEGYKPINVNGMPGATAENPDDRICNLIFERDKTKEAYEANRQLLEKAEKVLQSMDKELRDILIMSYVEELFENDIMKKLNISRPTYFRMKGRAIRQLARELWGIKAAGY